jgi:hypothetical protein
MAHFANLDENDTVINVIVVDKECVEAGKFGDPYYWKETDMFTANGLHRDEFGNPDGGIPLRGNYASIGGKYDRENDVFYDAQPYPSWTISGPEWRWMPPVPKPPRSDTMVNVWNESTLSWDQVIRR